jgi:hypothetical protein
VPQSPVGRPTLRAGLGLLLALSTALGATGGAHAAPPPTPGVQQDFAAAAAEFHVPARVLLAVGYQSSWWESHHGRPSTSGGYGPMHLTEEVSGYLSRHLIPVPPERLRTDDRQNIRGGAALLASYEKALTGGTPADPARWYGAVARYSGSPRARSARIFADSVYRTMRDGARQVRDDGQQVQLSPDPDVTADTGEVAALGAGDSTGTEAADTTGTDNTAGTAGRAAECPPDVDCRFVPASPANYRAADRPADGVTVDYIVIHDTESSYDSAITSFRNPAHQAAANYVMRSSDGAVTQMVPTQDVAFHAGNYWFNAHSVGIEHEGVAAQGATWYTPAQYRATAALVRYLAARFHIPLTRQHIIGHDNVPGPSPRHITGMHWDPGPYWDWTLFMGMLTDSTPEPPTGSAPAVGSAVTIAPDLATNEQTVRVCEGPSRCCEQREPSNFLPLRTAPGADAPLIADPALHPAPGAVGTDLINDWGDIVSAGQQFVVADRREGWTAIWFAGRKAWFADPDGRNTRPVTGTVLIARSGGARAAVFGTAFPRPGEYPPGADAHAQVPLGVYGIPAGQAYVAAGPAVRADDLPGSSTRPGAPAVPVSGAGRYVVIQFNHRLAVVGADDVTVTTATTATP